LISRFRSLPILRTNNRIGKKGFTLIELLIVSSIMAAVMLAVYSCFATGMKIWQRCQDFNQAESGLLIDLERISALLRRAVNFPPIGFEGSKEEISFPILEGSEITRISFPFLHQAEEVNFAYYYFDNPEQKYLWKEKWNGSEGVPIAVKITCKIKGRVKVATVFIPIA
jgi:prepilin-type N-terminal cleavage/methylation domain-containing protein